MSVSRAVNRAGLAACLLLVGSVGIQNAKAVGDTRTLTLHHVHTDEDLTITYKKNGQYDDEALKKINWIMRDWRKNEAVTMDREEIDLLWQLYQEVGAKEAIHIICGYRAPATNEMLRGRSKKSGVARNSQHTLGKAIDFYIPGVPLDKLRETAMKLQGGGVGYYPTSGSPFVHLDVGNVRAWPRMTREQLVKLFPDGRTVHLPASGDPLPGYQMARADIERGANHRTVSEPQKRSFLASLFSPDKDGEEAADGATARESAPAPRSVSAKSEARKFESAKPEPAKLEIAKFETLKPETLKPEINKPAAPARVQVASAAEPVATPAQPVPLPPRRPIYQIASAESQPAPPPRPAPSPAAPVQLASLSPNEIVSMRGLWDSTDPAPAKTPLAETNALSVSNARRLQTASAGRDTTASIGPFPTQDRVPAEVALAYAALADGGSRTSGKPPNARRPSSPTRVPPRLPTGPPTRSPNILVADRRAPGRPLAAGPGPRVEPARLACRDTGRRSGFHQPHPVHEKAGLLRADDVLERSVPRHDRRAVHRQRRGFPVDGDIRAARRTASLQ